MAVKFGMTVLEIIGQLTNGFRKVMGRDPDGLEKIKIQQEAVQRFKNMNKVVDMQGETIDTSKGIMGGRQIQDSPEFGQKVRETYDAAKGPGKGQEMVDALKSPGAKKSYSIMEEQLGVKLYGDESFEEILEIQRTGKHPRGEPGSGITSESLKSRLMEGKNPFSDLVEETKKGPKTIEQRRKEAEEALKNKNVIPFKDPDKKADGGRAGFANGSEDSGAPSIVLNPEERKMEKVFETDKVEDAIKEIIRRSIGPLDMAEIPLTEKGRLRFGFDSSGDRQISGGLDLLGGELNFGAGSGRQGKGVGFEFKKRFADGGRIGLKDGMSRRQFMKIMGGIATLPVLGKFIKPAMPLIQKGAEITGPALDKIVQTVMSAGKLISQSGRRLKELTTKKKLKDVEVEEDMMDGPSYTIKTKDKTIYYRPGKQDEMGIEDDIIEVIEDKVTKKAGGGIARMLGE
tara:strand:- start:3 stop:1373 length:1371 start_codon:yes stop_codon:yes gene_type:complete